MRYLFIIMFTMFAFSSSAQDWADLTKYKVANESLLESSDGENRIVLMGNSITEGWVNMRPEFFKKYPLVGRGISGQTTPQMLIRMRPDVINIHADAVVILAGINDIAQNTGPITLEEIAGNIMSMAELAHANGIKVILCSVLPAYDFPWSSGMSPNIKVPKLNTMIKNYAEANNFYYLDFFTNMADERNGLPKKYSEDEVHPTILGYSVMEPMLIEALEAIKVI